MKKDKPSKKNRETEPVKPISKSDKVWDSILDSYVKRKSKYANFMEYLKAKYNPPTEK